MTEPAQPKKSDLGVRVLSAIVMVSVAGTALWLGGWVWVAFVALVALGVLWEWASLVRAITESLAGRTAWSFGGFAYILLSAWLLAVLGAEEDRVFQIGILLGPVIGVDVGAYLIGRAVGGPKIAPKISPSKTWAGLFGGVLGASLSLYFVLWVWRAGLCQVFEPYPYNPDASRYRFDGVCTFDPPTILQVTLAGAAIAIVAQSGDFFESWMKRRAGQKDSSNLIPGHGGLFDRVDGLLAVAFVMSLWWVYLRFLP